MPEIAPLTLSQFQSTPSLGRATTMRHRHYYPTGVSIHALPKEATRSPNLSPTFVAVRSDSLFSP